MNWFVCSSPLPFHCTSWQLQRLQPKGRNDAVGELKFSPDGRVLAVGANDGIIDLFDASSYALVRSRNLLLFPSSITQLPEY
jgi:WD40 repeat protein